MSPRVVPNLCPACGAQVDAATAATEFVEYADKNDGGDRPTPGCVTACLYCGSFLVFDDLMQLRLAPSSVVADIDPASLRALRFILAAFRQQFPDRVRPPYADTSHAEPQAPPTDDGDADDAAAPRAERPLRGDV